MHGRKEAQEAQKRRVRNGSNSSGILRPLRLFAANKTPTTNGRSRRPSARRRGGEPAPVSLCSGLRPGFSAAPSPDFVRTKAHRSTFKKVAIRQDRAFGGRHFTANRRASRSCACAALQHLHLDPRRFAEGRRLGIARTSVGGCGKPGHGPSAAQILCSLIL